MVWHLYPLPKGKSDSKMQTRKIEYLNYALIFICQGKIGEIQIKNPSGLSRERNLTNKRGYLSF